MSLSWRAVWEAEAGVVLVAVVDDSGWVEPVSLMRLVVRYIVGVATMKKSFFSTHSIFVCYEEETVLSDRERRKMNVRKSSDLNPPISLIPITPASITL